MFDFIGDDSLGKIALYGFISIAAVAGLGCFTCYILVSVVEHAVFVYRRIRIPSSIPPPRDVQVEEAT